MKIAVIFAAVLITYVATEGDECPLKVLLDKTLEECVDTMKPSEETVENVREDKGVENKDTNCLRACMLKKAGLMDNAKVDLDKMEEIMKSGKNANKEAIEAVMGGLRACKEDAEKPAEDCEVAGAYNKCFNAMKDAAKE